MVYATDTGQNVELDVMDPPSVSPVAHTPRNLYMSTIPPSRQRNTPKPMPQVLLSGSPAVAREAFTSSTSPLSDSATPTREARIELAAYYRAELRGFVPAQELADWLEAESEIDALSARAPIS